MTEKKRFLIFCLIMLTTWIGTLEVFSQSSGTLGTAFASPDALGYGRNATGGRQGTVYRVNTLTGGTTTLTAVGDGTYRSSLRTALTQSGPRTIIFEVGGYIDLTGYPPLFVDQGDVTIFGETAPEGGITIRNGEMVIRASNVIVRHLRFRRNSTAPAPEAKRALSIGPVSSHISNIFIQICSISWCNGTMFTVWSSGGYRASNVTLQDCLIGGQLGESPMGINLGGATGDGTLVRNSLHRSMFIGAVSRNPMIMGGGEFLMTNCLVYNAVYSHGQLHDVYNYGPGRYAILNNLNVLGPNLYSYGSSRTSVLTLFTASDIKTGTQWYVKGNQTWDKGLGKSRSVYGTDLVYNETSLAMSASNPCTATELGLLDTNQVYDHIVANVGARPANRDSYDNRLINHLKVGTGDPIYVNDVSEIGGWPVLATQVRPLALPANYNSLASSGFTYLEEWAHDLAEGLKPDPVTPVAPQMPKNLRLVK